MADIGAITLAQETDEVFAWLLEFSHPSMAEPIRISSDRTEFYEFDENGNPAWCTRSRGNVYLTHEAFSFIPPGMPTDGTAPSAKFVISWAQEIIRAVSDVHEKVFLSGYYVNVADPDVPIATLPSLLLQSIEATGADISASLGIDHFLDEPAGRIKFLPSAFPGAFKNGVVTS